MSDILHATWLPALRTLFVWGEAGDSAPRKGRKAQLPTHPFQLGPERLREFAQSGVSPVPAEHALTLWLPSSAAAPFASPELLATGAQTAPEGQPHLAPWRVTGVLLTPGQALDLLLASPSSLYGADLRAWRVAALLAVEVLSGQQVLPGLQREGFQLRAAWLPRPAPATAQKLTELSRALPPLCRAATDDPANAPRPRALLDDFLAAVVDASIRDLSEDEGVTGRRGDGVKNNRAVTRVTRSRAFTLSPGGKWLSALLGADPIVDLRGPEADALYKAWQAWAGQAQVAGDDVFRITFRLEPPERAADLVGAGVPTARGR